MSEQSQPNTRLFVSRKSSKLQNSLDETMRVDNITYTYEISNSGPSTINEIAVSIQIPTAYISELHNQVELVNVNKAEVKAFYANKMLEAKWSKKSEEIGEFKEYFTKEKKVSLQIQNSTNKESEVLKNLPKDRTVYFDCSNLNKNFICSEVEFVVQNFKPGNETIHINLTFAIDLSGIGEKFCEEFSFFKYHKPQRCSF